MTRSAGRILLGAMLTTWAALVALTGNNASRVAAQAKADMTAEVDSLWDQIHGLLELRRLNVTAAQRMAMARVVTEYQRDRDALSAPEDPEALVEALTAVRDALLGSEEPTPEMWEAVEAAQGEGKEGHEQALDALQRQAVAKLAQVLTDEQKRMLAIPPVEEAAREIATALWRDLQRPADEQKDALARTLERINAEMGELTGEAGAQRLAPIIQGLVNRLQGVRRGEATEELGRQLVGELAAQLEPIMVADPQRLQERVNDRLGKMLEQRSLPMLLEDSANAMGAQ